MKKIFIVLTIIGFSMGTLFFSCLFLVQKAFNKSMLQNLPIKEKIKKVEDIFKVKFTKQTKLIATYDHVWHGWNVLVKIEMPREDLKSFLEKSYFQEKDLKKENKFPSNNNYPPWWIPHNAKNILSQKVRMKERKQIGILVDYDKENIVTVYLEYFKE